MPSAKNTDLTPPKAGKSAHVPAHAFMLGGEASRFALEGVAAGETKIPVSIVALSGRAVNHHYWETIVLDLAGFSQISTRLALDYCHDDTDIVGYIDEAKVEDNSLLCSGALVPFKENDRASEIHAKSNAGVPYEASLLWQGSRIEFVHEGVAVTVNGEEHVGPLYVAREWTVRGVAVCPHGVDPWTSTEFSASSSRKTCHVFSASTPPETPTMSDEADDKKTDDKKTTAEEKPADEAPEKEAEDAKEGEDEKPADEKKPCTCGAAEQFSGSRFMADFGDVQGAQYFARGLTHAQATVEHIKFQAGVIEELQKAAPAGAAGGTRFSASDQKSTGGGGMASLIRFSSDRK